MKKLAQQDEHFHTNQMFDLVYQSEYCNESMETLNNMTYEEFLHIYNRVLVNNDIKMAQEADHEREEAKNRQRQR